MQQQLLLRIIIAVVFFTVGALIAIPALRGTNSSSQASSQPTPSESATPTRTATRTPAPTPTATRSTPRRTPTATASAPAPSPTRTRTPTPTPTRTRTPSPSPTPSRSVTRAPAIPLTASIGEVQCPGRTVTVRVTNRSGQAQDYAIEQDDTPTVADRLGAGATRTSRLTLPENRRTTVAVTWNDRTLRSGARRADCSAPQQTQEPAPPRESLPRTGPADAATFAKVATGVAAMITGVIVFWYGGIWPRRRDQIVRIKR